MADRLDEEARDALETYRQGLVLGAPRREALWARIEASASEGDGGGAGLEERSGSAGRGRSRVRAWGWWLGAGLLAAGMGVVVRLAPVGWVGRGADEAAQAAPYQVVERARPGETAPLRHGPGSVAPEHRDAPDSPTAGAGFEGRETAAGRGTSAGQRRADPRARPVARGAREARGRADRSATDLAAEMALLRDARVALQARDPSAALRLLDRHDATFPGGQLEEDALALRIQALCLADRTEEVRSWVTRFVRRHPRSAHAVDAKDPCGASPSGDGWSRARAMPIDD